MKGLTLEIKFNNGRWLVNGKRLQDLSDTEKDFMNDFFKEVKAEKIINTPKTFYRVAHIGTRQGLWYDSKGKFTGLIHEKYDFCKNSKLEMPFNPNVQGWLSATDTLEDLYNWFPEEDILKLQDHNYFITVYEAYDYRFFENHYLIKQSSSRIVKRIKLSIKEPAL